MNIDNLQKLFNPKTIAVIGASNTPQSVGYSLFRNLLISGFDGTIYPVNPNHKHVQGVRAHATITEINEIIDLAIIAVPSALVPKIVDDCGKAGIHAIVVISAGFKEIGEAGEILTNEIKKSVKQYDISLLGPNCLGFIRPKLKLNASFGRRLAEKGNVAFISQSGALCTAILDWSVKEHVGFSFFISIGEMLDIGYEHLIEYLSQDEDTKSIVIYMESLSNAAKFLEIASKCALTKPIIVLKVGRSQEGSQAAKSHTGSITGNDDVFSAAFRKAGILRVNSIGELFDVAKSLAMQPLPTGSRLTIVTNAGGPGVIATDRLISLGGKLARVTEPTIGELNNILPPHWSHGNPVDILGDADPDRYTKTIEIVAKNPESDGVVFILTPQSMTDAKSVAEKIAGMSSIFKKPVLASFMGEDDVDVGADILEKSSIPVYEEPEGAVGAFINMHNFHVLQSFRQDVDKSHRITAEINEDEEILKRALEKGQKVLIEPEAKKIISLLGIEVPKGILIKNKEEINSGVLNIKFPVAMKIVSPQILHKTDVLGVKIGLGTPEDVMTSYDEIMNSVQLKSPESQIEGIYIEEMVHRRFELLLGMKKDPIFGPVVVFGAGGVAVEIMKDTSMGLPPITPIEAKKMIEETKISSLLAGYRGMNGINIDDLISIICKFSIFVQKHPKITEIDINPLSADKNGFTALDVKIVID